MKKGVQKGVYDLLMQGRKYTLEELCTQLGTTNANKCISRLRRKGIAILDKRGYDGRKVYWIDLQTKLDLM